MTSSPPRSLTLQRSATGCAARPARDVGARDGQGREAAVDVPVPRRRQPGSMARVRFAGRSSGRRRSTPSSPSNSSPAGVWEGTGVRGPEAFDARPFLDLLAADAPRGYGSPWGIEEKTIG